MVYAAQRYSELAAADKVGMTLKSEVAVDKPPALVHAALVRTYRLLDDKRSSSGSWLLLQYRSITPIDGAWFRI